MCARYAVYRTPKDMIKVFDLIEPADVVAEPNYNVTPTTAAPVVVRTDAGNALHSLRFGLLPKWAERKDPRLAARMINARAETIFEKPVYRRPVRERRCLVVTNGWYEWTGKAGAKTPWHMHRGGELLALAGVHENGTFSVITVPSNRELRSVHLRMPVLLDDPLAWLEPDLDDEAIRALLQSAPDGSVELHRVDRAVGNVRSAGPELIRPI